MSVESPESHLIPLDDDLWVADAPFRFLGTHLGTRMTVVRLSTGELWLHSPVPLDEQLKVELDAIGRVRHIVAPNLYHHLYVGHAAAAYPEATVYGVPGLADKRQDLTLHETLGEGVPAAWQGDLEQMAVDGTLLGETVFFHPATRTLISSDLVQNFGSSDHWWTRLYLGLQNIDNRFAHSLIVKLCYRDKPTARASIDALFTWDFDRVILAHGAVLECGGQTKMREAFEWLAG